MSEALTIMFPPPSTVQGMPSSRKQRPSLATIADMLGVSRTTVSNAYNRPQQLSPKLRAQILATATKIGYMGPDPTARSLRTRYVGSTGVLFTDHLTYAFEDVASLDFLAGMSEASSGTATAMTLVPVGPDTTDPTSARQLVNQAVVDGFVVYSVAREDPFFEAVYARGLPTVVVDQPRDPRCNFVGIDDAAAIAPAADALLVAGHRKIGVLCIRLDPCPNNGPVSLERLRLARHEVQRNRVQGALARCEAAGIDPAEIPVVERHINDPANNVDAARELLERHPELTAVLCTTDTMALGVMRYARARGIAIPEQLSVTGFDGTAPALAAGLHTVVQPNRRKGKEAASALQEAIARDDQPVTVRSLILPTTFQPGSSVAEPRATGELLAAGGKG